MCLFMSSMRKILSIRQLSKTKGVCLALVCTMVAFDAQATPLRDENILIPMQSGFVQGYAARHGSMDIIESVPKGESVENWSRMITSQIFHNQKNTDPDVFAASVAQGWKSACPDSNARKVTSGKENGYPYSLWLFECALNPSTGKPETMWMKVISGDDALYSVQYAYRSFIEREWVAPTMTFLRQVVVCDPRKQEHLCPSGM